MYCRNVFLMECEPKKRCKNKFTEEEDKVLRELVKEFGTAAWVSISQRMNNRNPRQCKERWFGYLSPSISNGPWTAEEDDLLIAKYKELGPSWKKITFLFPSRTDTNVKSRYKKLQRREIKKMQKKKKKKNEISEEIRTFLDKMCKLEKSSRSGRMNIDDDEKIENNDKENGGNSEDQMCQKEISFFTFNEFFDDDFIDIEKTQISSDFDYF